MEPEKISDAELIVRVRSGDASAMGELYARHADAALRVARATSRDPHLADDLVSSAFERVQNAISRGAGPVDSFRAYLYTVIRRLAAEAGVLKAREQDVDDWSPYEAATAVGGDAERTLEAQLVAKAFATLPERHQAVLWYLEVEGMTPLQAAPLFGLSPNATSALAVRARDALRVAYLQAHVSDNPVHAECGPIRKHLGGYLRSTLSQRDAAKVEAHLLVCDECPLVLEELKDVGYGLKSVFAPLLIGGGLIGGLLVAIGGGDDRAMAAVATAAGAAGAGVAGAAAASGGSGGGSAGSSAAQSSQATWVAAAAIAALATLGVATVVSATVNSEPAASAMAAPAESQPEAPEVADPVSIPTPTPVPIPSPVPVPPAPAVEEPEPEPPAPVVPSVPPPPAAATLALDFTEDQLLPDLSWAGRVLVTVTNSNGGPVRAVLDITLPAGVTIDTSRTPEGIADWACDLGATPVVCTSATIAPSGRIAIGVPVIIAPSALGARPIANVTVTAA